MEGNHGCARAPERSDMNNIWTRARVQAFAHQVAVERLEKTVRVLRIKEMAIAVSGIALLVVGYTLGLGLPSNAGSVATNADLRAALSLWSHVLLFLSTMVGIYGLYHTVTSERDQLITLQSRHKLLLRMFMNVSGKTRATIADIYDDGFYKFNIAFLHDLIASLQTAGENPSDTDYAEAHRRHFSVLDSARSEIAESYAPDTTPANADEDILRYGRLANHLLQGTSDRVRMLFDEVERIIEAKLPEAAHHEYWWSASVDEKSTQHQSWFSVGYDAALVYPRCVEFSRRNPAIAPVHAAS